MLDTPAELHFALTKFLVSVFSETCTIGSRNASLYIQT
jgi:hypothetical protein